MSPRVLPLFALSLALLSAPAAARGEKKEPAEAPKETEEVKQARAKLDKRLEQLGAKEAQVTWLTDPELSKVFPGETFFAVRFRQFPVAIEPPKNLKPSNVFAVSDVGVQRIRDLDDVGEFILPKLRGEVSKERAADAIVCAAALVREFVQDGFYKFDLDRKKVKLPRDEKSRREFDSAEATAVVTGGGNGQIHVVFHFDKGTPAFKHKVEVRPGPRPRCQATYLLHPDAVIRRICEEDLLIMGLAAGDYLMRQRAAASPELRREIDRVWRQIQANGW
jgi:hypothetical protein